MSIREEALQYVTLNPGRTAWFISQALGRKPGTVSSVLLKLTHSGEIFRVEPKDGGFLYYRREPPQYASRFRRIGKVV